MNPWDEFSGEQPSPIKRQLQGPRPFPLKVNKDSQILPKLPAPLPVTRQPVIIYAASTKLIHTTKNEFRGVVERFTGPSSGDFSGNFSGDISPAARLATIEKTSPSGRERGMIDGFEMGNFPGILSPAPASLARVSAGMFSPGIDMLPNSILGPDGSTVVRVKNLDQAKSPGGTLYKIMDKDALYAAAIAGDADAIAKLEMEADRVDQSGNTIIHVESKNGNTERVRFILREFAHKNLLAKLNKFKWTALHHAAWHGRTEVAEILIDAARHLPVTSFQAFLRQADISMDTALHKAVMYGDASIVKLLVEADPSDTHIQNSFGETPMFIAVKNGYNDIVELISTTCTAPSWDGPHGSTVVRVKNLDQRKSRPIISSWEKGRLLGRGSFGSVYEGVADGGLFLAVKEVSLLGLGVQGRQRISELQQEIDLLSKLKHENIVRYLGTELTESNLYIFLELASKGSLLSLYQKYHLQDSQLSVYTRQILNGLKYLHDRNVVHRDIKCANILVDTNGTVKLADFGLAKVTTLNDAQSCKGTAFWMAPEVVKSSQGYGLAADIWSLGCTVLELLTGQLPYHPLECMQAVDKIGKSIPPPIPDSLSTDARDFILKCLQVDPFSRPTAAQLLDHSFVKRSIHYREVVSSQGKSRPIISSWEKGKLLGRGPFGSVYEEIAEMEVLIDFHKSEGTLLDITELSGLLENEVQFEFLKSKSVVVRRLKVISIRNSKIPEIPDNLSFPDLEELYLQSNLHISYIPSSFFKHMPALKVLDMSNTSIKTVPPPVFELLELEQLILQRCELLMELPPEISALKNLKVLDLEGTDLVCLPDELKDLTNLKCLKVSLYDAESYRKSKKIVVIIPVAVLSKLTHLEELTIDVDPQDVWCNPTMKAIMEDLPSLRKLKTLKLYLPTTELLKDLVELKWNNDNLPIYQNLLNFNFIIGPRAQRFISRLPSDLEEEFLKLKKCIKYINGEEVTTQFAEALKHANALYLDRHWTIQNLSIFNLEKSNELKFCLLVDCNEMQAVFDGSDFNRGVANKGENLLSLQYLAIHYLKNLEVIWNGPGVGCCSHTLRVLALHMCPNLTTIFTPVLLGDLHNLKEIIVEDCPKITSLIAEDSTQLTSKEILPRLKKLSLFYLPELVSISSGLSIGPELENLVIYDCPKLKRLPSLGVCNKELIEIRGESEWWNALKWNEPEWNGGQPHYLHRAFSELDTDGDYLDELAPQYGNSLRLFVEECDAN